MSAAATSTENPKPDLLSLLKQNKEWAKAVIFDQDGNILAATIDLLPKEMEGLLKLYSNREDTIRNGVVVLNEQYDVHRFHPPLIYGRKGDSAKGEGEGVAVCKIDRGSDQKTIYALITYYFPIISAKAVPDLQRFCEDHLTKL